MFGIMHKWDRVDKLLRGNTGGGRKAAVLGLLLMAVLVLAGCAGNLPGNPADSATAPSTAGTLPSASAVTAAPTPTPTPKPVETRVSLAAIGDVLIHGSVYRDALRHGGGSTYDFKPMFTEVAEALRAADVTFANSESMIGGTELGLSDYPRFNSPHELGDALKDMGVDVVSTANNHTLDRGEAAVKSALAHWDKLGVCAAGSAAEAGGKSSCTLERKGVKMTFLAYTYGTNGIPVPAGKDHLVNLIDRDRLAADIRAAKQQADAVIVSLHFGIEYQTLPNEEQKSLAKLAVDSGAVVVLGHHAHVLQPTEWIPTPDGGQALVVYSLGNFIAAQESAKTDRRVGGILSLELVRRLGVNGHLTVTVEKPKFQPTYIDFASWRNFRVLPLKQVDKLGDGETGAARYETVRKHMTRWMPELEID